MDSQKILAIKLVTGEELVCEGVCITQTEDTYTITVNYPYKIEYNPRKRKTRCNFTPWLLANDSPEHVIDCSLILDLHQILDDEMIKEYKRLIPKKKLLGPPNKIGIDPTKENTSGYIGNTSTTRELLEKIYKSKSSDRS